MIFLLQSFHLSRCCAAHTPRRAPRISFRESLSVVNTWTKLPTVGIPTAVPWYIHTYIHTGAHVRARVYACPTHKVLYVCTMVPPCLHHDLLAGEAAPPSLRKLRRGRPGASRDVAGVRYRTPGQLRSERWRALMCATPPGWRTWCVSSAVPRFQVRRVSI